MKPYVAALLMILLTNSLRAEGPLRVAVSIPPQAGLLAQIAGDLVAVETLVGAGQSPHTYEPTPRQLARLAGCGLYFTVGMPFERTLMPRLQRTYPALRVVNTAEGFGAGTTARPAPGEHAADHANPTAHAGAPCCPAGHHGHGEDDDPHLWVAPAGMLHQARLMTAALAEADPDNAARYQDGLRRLTERITALDEAFRQRFAPHQGQAFLVYHPAWGHFARAYGLRQRAVERHGMEPGARHLATLIDEARAAGFRGVLVQSDAEARRVRPLSEPLALQVHQVQPLEADPFLLLESTAEAIAQSLPAAAVPAP